MLQIMNPETQEVISEKEYKSMCSISRDLNTTYCSVYSNFQFNDKPDVKPSKKTSQKKFNLRYKIVSINP